MLPLHMERSAPASPATQVTGWGPPYLLYLGNAPDDLAAKTARGLAHWRPEWCVGQFRGSECRTSIGLPDLDFAQAVAAGANTMIVGVANAGGVMGEETVQHVVQALKAGMNVASGLHEKLTAHPQIVATARECGRTLFDARTPPETPVGKGLPRRGKRLLTVGTDCSVGKMYATLAIEKELRARGVAADFRATGQTGIFIAGRGIPLDAVVADFISGGVEWLTPGRDDDGWDLIEGQGSLFHASFAGVSLGLLHGAAADALVLCHEPGRPHMRGLPHYPVPELAACLEKNLDAARLTNPNAVAVGVAVNTAALTPEEAERTCRQIGDQLGLPCQDPVRNGVARIVDRLQQCFAN
ncbi:MAG: DUF1611 domain-containing protein [Pseudoxanthomonas sp.]